MKEVQISTRKNTLPLKVFLLRHPHLELTNSASRNKNSLFKSLSISMTRTTILHIRF